MLIRCASLVGHLWFNIDPKNKKIKNKITSNKYKIEFENKKPMKKHKTNVVFLSNHAYHHYTTIGI